MKKRTKWILAGISALVLCGVLTFVILSRDDIPDNPNNSANNSTEPQDSATQSYEARLPQSVIDEAVRGCKDSQVWGIALAIIRINYKVGAEIEGAIVLHNGEDYDRIVTLACQCPSGEQLDESSNEYYKAAPGMVQGWVSIDANNIRLAKMETKVVKIVLLVPEGTNILSGRWEFHILATGIVIDKREMSITATTEADSTTLVVRLPEPLLQNSLSAVLSIGSSINEAPRTAGYDVSTRELTIEGLESNSVRTLKITYEYGLMLRTAYNQRWLIKMV